MKKNLSITALLAFGAFALVSCEQPTRVVNRPLGSTPGYAANVQPADPNNLSGTSLMDQLVNPDPNTPPALDPLAGNTPGTGTLGTLIGPGTGTTTPGAGTGTTITPSITPTPPPTTASPEILVAWPDPSDPTVVRSPYDRSKKIRITKPDGTRHPSGTVLWDPNYPKSENKKFRVP